MANQYKSYAYDPKGNKVDVYVKDGLTYTQDGKRIGAGYTIQTAGGIYKMGEDGKGYKIDNHNTAPVITQPTKTTNQTTTPIVTSTPKTTTQSNPTSTVTKYENPYTYDYDYYNKGNVGYINPTTGDSSVTGHSVWSGLIDDEYTSKGYIKVDNPDIVKKLQDNAVNTSKFTSIDDWNKMLSDSIGLTNGLSVPSEDDIRAALARLEQYNAYKEYTNSLSSSNSTRINSSDAYNDAINRKLNFNDNIIKPPYTTNNVNSNLTSNNNTTLNTSNVMLLNPNNPNDGVVYKTNNGIAFEINGQQVKITEDEFIKFMTEYLGF